MTHRYADFDDLQDDTSKCEVCEVGVPLPRFYLYVDGSSIGLDASQTTCEEFSATSPACQVCAANQFVSTNTCVDCPTGSEAPGGEEFATSADTGPCTDIDGCTLFTDGCNVDANADCSVGDGTNTRTCTCAAGTTGTEVDLGDDESHTACVVTDGCTLFTDGCGGDADAACSLGDGINTRTCTCGTTGTATQLADDESFGSCVPPEEVVFFLPVDTCDVNQFNAIAIAATTQIINTGVPLIEILSVTTSCADGLGTTNRRARRASAFTYAITVSLAGPTAAASLNAGIAAGTVIVFANGGAVGGLGQADLANGGGKSGKSGKSGGSTAKSGKAAKSPTPDGGTTTNAKSGKTAKSTPSSKGGKATKTSSKAGKAAKGTAGFAAFTAAEPKTIQSGAGVAMVAGAVVGLALLGYYSNTRKQAGETAALIAKQPTYGATM